MIPAGQSVQERPGVTLLDEWAMLHMLGWLSQTLRSRPVTEADWREAYGSAVDDQTARMVRAELRESA